MDKADFAIAGAGLAGCECALALARRGFSVALFEQKPHYRSEAHVSDGLAELVCSNSLRNNENTSGIGLLKNEMRALGSPFMAAADKCRVPAGKALAVDRELFSREIGAMVEAEEKISLVRRRIESVDDDVFQSAAAIRRVVAAGPLAFDGLADSLAQIAGSGHCYFYDAIAPIVWTESVDMSVAFRASRYGDGEGDYLNCPMNREQYLAFHSALLEGEVFKPHGGEKHFEGCMPIEALASRGVKTLAFGPMKPVGLTDPATGLRPYAVLQLRPEKANLETCNLVGCQTKLLQGEQKRIFRLVPGLQNAEFARFGSMHRNLYLNAPQTLNADLSLKARPDVHCAGQITGVEGYVESAACGLWLGLVLASLARGGELRQPPPETALGSLLAHLQRPVKNFQPSNAHFGLMPEFAEKIRKKERRQRYAQRAEDAFAQWLEREKTGLF